MVSNTMSIAILVAVLVTISSCVPVPQEVIPGYTILVNEPSENAGTGFDLTEAVGTVEERGDRHRRVTCDLLSVSVPWGSLNHAACAAHCLAMGKGYRGGRCIDGVCNCRR